MAVIVQYIVEKNGIQKMTFDNKKDADAYDKELDITANLLVLLEKADVTIDEIQMEDLCLFLAKNKDQAVAILKGATPKADTSSKPAKGKAESGVNKAKDKNATVESTNDKSVDADKGKIKAA